MAKKYYHNIDKDIYNETDFIEFMDRFSIGDTIFWTEGGNAILNKPTPTQIQSMEDEYEEWQIQQEDEKKNTTTDIVPVHSKVKQKYYIGIDLGTEDYDLNTYCLAQKADGTTNIILIKSGCNKEEFEAEVENLRKLLSAEVSGNYKPNNNV